MESVCHLNTAVSEFLSKGSHLINLFNKTSTEGDEQITNTSTTYSSIPETTRLQLFEVATQLAHLATDPKEYLDQVAANVSQIQHCHEMAY
jgi:hypothetical protein